MARRIDIDLAQALIRISFPYDATCVAAVKALPGRRFNSSEKVWTVPMEHGMEVVAKLEPLHFSLGPAMREIWAEQGGESQEPMQGLSVSGLNAQVAGTLADAFPEPVWLIGELAGYDKGRSKRHAYFDLVERREADVVSKVRAVAFEANRRRVAQTLRESPGGFQFGDGVEVRLLVRIEFYAAAGSFQVSVVDIDPEYTLSKIRAERERILRMLEAEGIRHQNLDLPFPVAPTRVALITSAGSDAEADFVHELRAGGFRVELTILDARMQGVELEPTVLRALSWGSAA